MLNELPAFQLVVTPDTQGAYARVRGRLVLGAGTEARAWRRAVARATGRILTLDLCGVNQIDAAGVGTLVDLQQRVRQHGGRVQLASASARVRRVLALTGVDRLLMTDVVDADGTLPCDTPPASYYRRRLSSAYGASAKALMAPMLA